MHKVDLNAFASVMCLEQGYFISREVAMAALSQIRYPGGDGKPIGPTTFWRWCKIAGIPPRVVEFELQQFSTLLLIATYLRQGYNYDWVSKQLGNYHEPTKEDRFNFSSYRA